MTIDSYEVVRLDESSWLIEDSFVRAFLFIGTKKALLVDTATGKGDIAALIKQLTNLPVILVNTHADEDHIGGNHGFTETYMHPSEFAYYSEKSKPHDAIARPLWEGENIDIGGRIFEVLLIPGHTPGSIALLDRANRILISGDSVSIRPIFVIGKGSSFEALHNSLRRLMEFSDSFDKIYPSHGPYPLGKEQIEKEIRCYELIKSEKLLGKAPPIPINAQMFMHDGAGFYLAENR